MARTPEGKVKQAVRLLLAEYKPLWVFWPVQTGYGRATVDCIGIYRGRGFAIETKAPGLYPTPRQDIELVHLREAGAETFVIDGQHGLGALKAWLDKATY